MSVRAFIATHRLALEAYIRRRSKLDVGPDYKDIHEWILNDETLYRWAQSEGVRI